MHALVLDQVFHRFGVVLLAPRLADHVTGCAGVLDDRLEVGRQAVPFRLVDDQLACRRGLVPAGRVVVFGGTLQSELAVEIGSDELGGIDHAALERRKDFAGGQQPHIDAERLIDAPGEAGNAHLQALEVIDLLDRLLEPAGHLHAGIAAQERHQVESVVDLAPELRDLRRRTSSR